ncbi:CAP domain-containing protein [Desulfotomaculum sp. 1211_IL3151]|uniref:CAP domain-containing protein n=1 Tax=Desulfotomaculum sp. 1211_IL3151 TaxID=3084055 RepID=UPI002FD95D29
MKKAIKLFSSLMVGAFAFVLAVSAPGTGSAEAYVSYNNTTSSSPNYKVYNTTNYQSYNYNNTKPATNTQTTYNKPTYNQPTYNQPSANNTGSGNQSSGVVVSSDEQAMLSLINKERAAAGLKPLSMDAALTKIARTKAKDMVDNNYFSHTSPTYGSPFDMMKKNGVVYHYAGENLAGASNVNTAHANLMNSPSHKANILKPEYTKVGIGVVSGSKYGKIYVQEFNG